MCELIDVKMTLTFCLLFVVKRMVIVVFFNEILNSSTHLLTYNYKIDVENKKKMVQDDPFSSTNVLCSLIWMINSKYASQYD